jgi:transcriptional regulator of arginine metabolism
MESPFETRLRRKNVGGEQIRQEINKPALHIYTKYRIFMQARSFYWDRALQFDGPQRRFSAMGETRGANSGMKIERHSAIRDLVSSSLINSQDELRRKLRRRGFAVTQATLSRDLHEMHLFKGPSGYGLPNGNGGIAAVAEEDDDSPPGVAEVLETFGLRSRQAMNQVVIGTVMGGAQPVAAALDYEEWPEVLGTIAGDDTVLVICPDIRLAAEVQARLRKLLA